METLFENSEVLVEKNGSDEIFVSNKQGVKIRISPTRTHIHVTAGNGGGRLEPDSVNGLPAIRVWTNRYQY